MAKSTTKARTVKTATSNAAKPTLAESAKAAQPQGEPTHLATPAEETAQRKEATKPVAVKEAIKDGKKDPIAKFGDPDADPVETAARRAVFG